MVSRTSSKNDKDEDSFMNKEVKYGAKVLGQLSDSRTSYYPPVTIVQRAD